MKLLVLGINYYPELTGIAVYNTEMCEYLAKKGHDIQMLTSFPYYPFGVDFSSWYKEKQARFSLFLTENINNVNVKRVNLYKSRKMSTIKRIIHELSFLFWAMVRLLFSFKKYALIICIAPPLLLGLVAYIVSKCKGVPFVFHVQDLQPDAAVELGMLKKGLFTSFLYSIEHFIYNKADYISTISEGMQNKIISKGFAKDKVKLFYNWANIETLKPMTKNNSFARKHSLDKKFVVLHAGNMGEKQDMRIILEAARKMKLNNSICFLLVGRGTKRSFVEEYIKKNALSNVLLLEVQPKSVVNQMFSCADVALITQIKEVKNTVMPSKIFGPALVEKPLIVAAAGDCEISKVVKKYNFGIVITPEDPNRLVAAINRLKKDRKWAELMGKNGRLFMIKERKMERIIDQFEESILRNYDAKRLHRQNIKNQGDIH